MSDVMLYGILRMPYEMAMNDELSRFQFYQRAQQALDRISKLEKDLHMIQRHYDQLDDHPAFKGLTYADGIEECAQRAEAYAYMSPNFTALAEELRAILRKAQEK